MPAEEEHEEYREFEGEQYLTASQSADYLGMSYTTFQSVREQYKLQHRTFAGKSRYKYYRKTDLDNINKS